MANKQATLEKVEELSPNSHMVMEVSPDSPMQITSDSDWTCPGCGKLILLGGNGFNFRDVVYSCAGCGTYGRTAS